MQPLVCNNYKIQQSLQQCTNLTLSILYIEPTMPDRSSIGQYVYIAIGIAVLALLAVIIAVTIVIMCAAKRRTRSVNSHAFDMPLGNIIGDDCYTGIYHTRYSTLELKNSQCYDTIGKWQY